VSGGLASGQLNVGRPHAGNLAQANFSQLSGSRKGPTRDGSGIGLQDQALDGRQLYPGREPGRTQGGIAAQLGSKPVTVEVMEADSTNVGSRLKHDEAVGPDAILTGANRPDAVRGPELERSRPTVDKDEIVSRPRHLVDDDTVRGF